MSRHRLRPPRPAVPVRRLADLALVVAAVAVLALVVATLRGPAAPPSAASLVSAGARTAVFLGDDALAAWAGRVAGASAADGAAEELGWSAEVEALEGSGFVAGSWSGRDTYGRQVEGLAGRRPPDVLVVLAGTGERVHPPEAVRAAAVATVGTARRTLGLGTRLVLVGPLGSPDPQVAAALAQVRTTLRDVARAERVHFLDPVAEGWLAGAPAFAPDGLRLTPEGDRLLGRRLAAALERLLPAAA